MREKSNKVESGKWKTFVLLLPSLLTLGKSLHLFRLQFLYQNTKGLEQGYPRPFPALTFDDLAGGGKDRLNDL